MIASVLGGVLYAVIHDLRGFDLIWMMIATAFNCYIAAGFFDEAFPKEREKESISHEFIQFKQVKG
jgi:hypothetical protein